jgi:ribosomal protein L16 Arg81 hydroxylase
MSPELRAKIAANKAKKEMYAQVESAVKTLSTLVNRSNEHLPEIISEVLMGEHRTLQQGVIRALRDAMEIYGNESRTDLRNEGAKSFCKEVAKIDHCMPFI